MPLSIGIFYIAGDAASGRHASFRLLLMLLAMLLFPFALALDLTAVTLFLLAAPFQLLVRCYGRNVRATAQGVEIYTLAGEIHSHHAWSDIEAFWEFNRNRSYPFGRPLWHLVLKSGQTIVLPEATTARVGEICKAMNIPTNGYHFVKEVEDR